MGDVEERLTGAPSGVFGWVAPVLVVALLPLAVLPGAFGPFHVGKWLVAVVAIPAGLVVYAASGTLRWPYRNWFLAWLGVGAVAALTGVAPWMSLIGSPTRNAGVLASLLGAGAFVLGASGAVDGATQRRVLRATFVTGGVVGAVAVTDRLGVDLFGVGDGGEITRARSTWGSATFAGAHLALVLPLAVAQLRNRNPAWRAAAALSSASIIAGLLATGTRAAWLATVVAAALMARSWRASGRFETSAGDRPSGPLARLPRWLAPAGVALALLIAAPIVASNLGRSTAEGRVDQWRTSLPVIADRPLLGSGPDTQRSVLPAGIDAAFERDHGSDELHDRVHALPLDTLVTTGVIGLVALGGLLWVLARDITSRLRGELVPTAIAAGLTAYLATQLFAFGDPVIDPIAWLLAGLLIGARASVESPDDGSRLVSVSRRARTAIAVGFGALTFCGLLLAGGEVLAEYRLQQAFNLWETGDVSGAVGTLESAAKVAPARFDLDQIAARFTTQSLTEGAGPDLESSDTNAELFAAAMGRLDRAQRIAGDDPDVLMDRAELLTAAGDPTAALQLYDEIFVRYPRSFRANLGDGLAASQLGHRQNAEDAWLAAADLAPRDARAQLNLGLLFEADGDIDAALAAFLRATEIDPDNGAAAAGIARLAEGQTE